MNELLEKDKNMEQQTPLDKEYIKALLQNILNKSHTENNKKR